MEAIKFTEQILINEKSEKVFDFTQNYNNRLKWDTFLKKADLIDGATIADKGVRAYCVAPSKPGNHIKLSVGLYQIGPDVFVGSAIANM